MPRDEPWVLPNRTHEQPTLSNSAAEWADGRLDELNVAPNSHLGYRLADLPSSVRGDSQKSRRLARHFGPLRGTLCSYPSDALFDNDERQRAPFFSRDVCIDEEVLQLLRMLHT